MKIPVLILFVVWPLFGQTYTLSTFAGGGLPVNIAGPSASIGPVSSVAVDAAGSVYSPSGGTILRLDAITRILTVVAGTGRPGAGFSGDNGPAADAQLQGPNAIAVDAAGNIYIADGNRIRKISGGIVTTVAGTGTAGVSGDNGPATSAQIAPLSLAVDAAGNIYFTDIVASTTVQVGFPGGVIIVQSGSVRKISHGTITTIAGNGTCCSPTADNAPATSVPLYEPSGIAVDGAGNLYVACSKDVDNPGLVRKISGGVITTVAGGGSASGTGDGGPATNARLLGLSGAAVDGSGNLYVGDLGHNTVRKISGGTIATVAGYGTPGYGGDGAPATEAQLNVPEGVAVDSAGNLYIADSYNDRVREVSNGLIATVAGNGTVSFSGDNGPATSAQFASVAGLAVDSAGNLYIADLGGEEIRQVSHGIIADVAGDGVFGFGGDNGPATSANLYNPAGIAVDSAGNLYIADTANSCIRKVSGGIITTIAGRGSGGLGFGDGGPATSAFFESVWGVAVDAAGNVYVSDPGAGRVRKIANGIITAVAGNGTRGFSGDNGPATGAALNYPYGIAVDAAGNLYIDDSGNNRIREVSGSVIATVAGGGSPAVDAAGNLYIAANGAIGVVSRGGAITTIAGTGIPGYSGENVPALSAQITPGSLAVDAAGDIYFVEANRVRVLKPCGAVCTAPAPAVASVLNAASFQPGIEAGSWVMIQGANLANTNPGRTWTASEVVNGNLPTSLDGVSVTIDGRPAFVEYISPSQINVQAPSDSVVGAVNVVVTNNGAASAPATAQLQAAAPAFFVYPGTNYAIASLLPDYAEVGDPPAVPGTVAAKPGDTLALWGTGFGATNPAVPAGTTVTGAPAVVMLPMVTIGGVPVPVVSAVLTKGSAGLYQVTMQLPATVPAGAVAVQASVGGVPAPAVFLYVSNP
jgi:uncharacterized protein (TIGR03437 family)